MTYFSRDVPRRVTNGSTCLLDLRKQIEGTLKEQVKKLFSREH